MLPGKDRDYRGPISNRAICDQIALDAKSIGLDVSGDEIAKVVGLFFRHMKSHMVKGDSLRIDALGDFGMDPKEKVKRVQKDWLKDVRKEYLKRVAAKRKWHNDKIKNEFLEFNRKRVEKGLKEWKYWEWRQVHKRYKKWKRKPIDMYKMG